MSVYAIGDVQGCYDALRRLLDRLRYDPGNDRLWFTGDLVNRGPDSLRVLRFVRNLGERAVTVLGNHDLHLLAVAMGRARVKKHDTLDEVLSAPDRDELLDWLRRRALLHHDPDLGYTLLHAGLLPPWDLPTAQRLAREAERVLASGQAGEFFAHMYGDLPDHWRDDLRGFDRLRVIVNAFTRLRFCDFEGNMDLRLKGAPGTQPPGMLPWFQVPHRRNRGVRVVFGHWSTLGPYRNEDVICLDSGCLWGRELSAVRLDAPDTTWTRVPCPGQLRPAAN
jgi:bis(5'-nucleosyl)-tetraphosphatase (symmetrical)